MSSKQDHLNYIKEKGDFHIDCSTIIFSSQEIAILKKFGHWFDALEKKKLEPITELQIRFVNVCQGNNLPFSIDEKAWFKYCGRRKLEQEQTESLKAHYRFDSEFFSRDDYYKMHPYKKGDF